MTVNFKQIGRRVKEIRRAKGMSRALLAAQIDMSVPYINLIDPAAKRASLSTQILIADALGVRRTPCRAATKPTTLRNITAFWLPYQWLQQLRKYTAIATCCSRSVAFRYSRINCSCSDVLAVFIARAKN